MSTASGYVSPFRFPLRIYMHREIRKSSNFEKGSKLQNAPLRKILASKHAAYSQKKREKSVYTSRTFMNLWRFTLCVAALVNLLVIQELPC